MGAPKNPATISDLELETLLRAASEEPFGLLLRTNSIPHAKVRFNSLRRKLRDPELDALQLGASRWKEGDLVIYRPGAVLPEGQRLPDQRGLGRSPRVEDLL
jgi:hypothetical protein